MSTPQNTYLVNKGTDLNFTFNWPDGAGGNADLTGYTVAAYDVDSAISSLLTVTLTTANVGLITVSLQWDETLSIGVEYKFRIKSTLSALDVSTNEFIVWYR